MDIRTDYIPISEIHLRHSAGLRIVVLEYFVE